MYHQSTNSQVPNANAPVPGEQNNNDEIVKKSPWLHAWSNPVAGVRAYSQLITLADVYDDGDNKLIIADMNKKLRVYKGTNEIRTMDLADTPIAVETFYSNTKKPSISPFLNPSVTIYCSSMWKRYLLLPKLQALLQVPYAMP